MNTQKGYVALLAVLIIGAASTAIAVVLLTTGVDSQRTALVTLRSTQARNLATACAEEALQQIYDSDSFTGSNNLSMGQGSCTYSVVNTGGLTRSVAATGTVDTVVRRVKVLATRGTTGITINSWQEVGTFISHVQSNGTFNDVSALNISQAFSSNNTAGNLIVVAVSWDSTATQSFSCADTRGNTYTTVNVWNDSSNRQALAICYAANVAAGSNTVTATFASSSPFRRIVVSEYSGVATVSPVDVSTGVGGSTATTVTDAVTSGTATTTRAGDLIYGAVVDTDSLNTITAGTGFIQRFVLDNDHMVVQDLQQTIAGSVASTQTFSLTHRYDAAMVAFKSIQ